jgi:HSP20 family protein
MTMLPSLSRRGAMISPLEALWNLQRDMDHIFNGTTTEVQAWPLPAEVYETDNEIRFVIEVPGLRPDDIHVTVENNILTVSGEKKAEREEGQAKGEYHLFERRYGRFERSFALPRSVESENINASYDNGLLTVVLPKTEAAKPRRIPVNAATGAREISSGR